MMTGKQARKLLEHPVFGNFEHICAVKVLEQEEEAQALRVLLEGKTTECWCCTGTGSITCDAGCDHDCPTCDGSAELTLSPRLLADLTLGQLQDLAREVVAEGEGQAQAGVAVSSPRHRPTGGGRI